MASLNVTLLKWWIQVSCIVFGSVVAYQLGWWHALWDADITKISIGILGVFAVTMLLTGYISKNYQDKKSQALGNYVWFASEAMITLGMIGTVAGFLLMLGTAFSNLDVTNIANIQAAIADMAIGMSTALSTTLVGLICSILTKAQMVILENSWENGD
jgi:hypothetical protein